MNEIIALSIMGQVALAIMALCCYLCYWSAKKGDEKRE